MVIMPVCRTLHPAASHAAFPQTKIQTHHPVQSWSQSAIALRNGQFCPFTDPPRNHGEQGHHRATQVAPSHRRYAPRQGSRAPLGSSALQRVRRRKDAASSHRGAASRCATLGSARTKLTKAESTGAARAGSSHPPGSITCTRAPDASGPCSLTTSPQLTSHFESFASESARAHTLPSQLDSRAAR
jgi:hypothetical protein